MKREKTFLSIIIFGFLLSFISATDGDCRRVASPSENNCFNINTETPNVCCYSEYKDPDLPSKTIKCITLDGTSPHYLLQSQKNVKKTFPGQERDKIIKCLDVAEECEGIQMSTSFDSCQTLTSQQLKAPFVCCYIESSTGNYCYPVNAKYNTTVAAFADELKLIGNLDATPKITCSKTALPGPPGAGAFLNLNYSLIVISIIIHFLM